MFNSVFTKFLFVWLIISLTGLSASEKKIITIGSAATEIVYELGLGKAVVARDYGSVFPKAVLDLPSLGANHKFNIEELLKYRPTHVVVDDRRATLMGVIEKLRKASVTVVEVKILKSVDETKDAVLHVAKAFDLEVKGKELVAKIDSDLKKVEDYYKSKKAQPKTIFIYARGIGTLFLAGEGTSAQELLKLAGAEPGIKGISGYKPINAEKIIVSNPEAVFMFASGLESLGGVNGLNKVQGLKLTKAVKNKRVVAMDDRSTNLGPRIGLFAMELSKKLHGDLDSLTIVNE